MPNHAMTRLQTKPPRRCSGDSGQSVIEALTAMGIAALAGLIMVLMMQVLKSEANTEAKSIADGRVSNAMKTVLGSIREARPIGTCANPVGAALPSCRSVAERPFTFIQAQPLASGGVCVYASPIGAAPLTIPSQVCVRTEAGENGTTNLVRSVIEGSGTYTTPAWTATPFTTLLVADVDPATTTVMYTLDGGTAPAASYSSATDLRSIALVEFDVTTRQIISGTQKIATATLEFSAAPRGSRYSRDQDYDELGG